MLKTNVINRADVWLGRLTPVELEEYINETFDQDGDSIASKFQTEFSLPWLDHDFVESHSVVEYGKNIFTAFDGFSFSSSYKADVLERCEKLRVEQPSCAIICFGLEVDVAPSVAYSNMVYLGRFSCVSE
jgi:hypothetical protein